MKTSPLLLVWLALSAWADAPGPAGKVSRMSRSLLTLPRGLLACVFLALPSSAGPPPGPGPSPGPLSEGCAASHTTPDGTEGFKSISTCVSSTGNVTELGIGASTQGGRYLRDGYRICHRTANNVITIAGTDNGLGPGTLGPPILTQPSGAGTFPLTVARTTNNGLFQLTQTFTRQGPGDPDLYVQMSLQYLGPGLAHDVTLVREFDREFAKQLPLAPSGNSPPSPPADEGFASASTTSAFGWNHGLRYGLMLSVSPSSVDLNAPTWVTGVRAQGLESTEALCTGAGLDEFAGPGNLRGRVVFQFGTLSPPPQGLGFPTNRIANFRYWIF